MKKSVSIFIVFSLTVFFCFSCGTDVTKKTSIDSTSHQAGVPDEGKVLYSEKCSLCHGENGDLGSMGAANLVTSKINSAAVLAIMRDGKNGMRSFASDLNVEQLNAVAKYAELLRR
ncbi:MAG: cytochrome c [Bacteroidetes bacterium]|nr:cytochrome c [Bacteroidota bacterium]PHX82061.1 MAG: hypothetical protein CK539_06550 [Flavobacteriales bacterium]